MSGSYCRINGSWYPATCTYVDDIADMHQVTPHRSSSQERYAQTNDIQPPMMPKEHAKPIQGGLLPPDPAFDDNEAF
jgi:hypothetical protein